MIITLEEAKQYLRLEPELTAEDAVIQTLISAAESYVQNATGQEFDSTNALAKLLCFVLVVDWYENREMVGKVSEQVRPTVTSILAQLQHCYPVPEEEPLI